MPNSWTDRDQIRHTYADSSGNGHRLNKLTGSRPEWAFGRGLGGHKFKNVGKIPNSWTDQDHIWHTYADSSRNGCRLKKKPLETSRGICRKLGGHKCKNVGKVPNRWTNRDQIWHLYADSSGNGHKLNKLTPQDPLGMGGGVGGWVGVWGKKFKSVGNLPLICPTCNMTDYAKTIPGVAG